MNPYTGELIEQVNNETKSEFRKRLETLGAVPLSEEQYQEVKDKSPEKRKGYMRNQPCPLCDSGKKFKKCCW